MKAEQDRRKLRQKIEQLDDPDLLRLLRVSESYADPDDPMALALAQIQEAVRQYVVKFGLCDACLAKLPDPLAP